MLSPRWAQVFTTFSARTPQLYLDVDREAAMQMGVSLEDVNTTLNANMGSAYVNQFNKFGRIWQVSVQAAGEFRTEVDKLKLLQVRNRQGQAVPLGTAGAQRQRSRVRHALQRQQLRGDQWRDQAWLQFRPGHCRDGATVQAKLAAGNEL
jgi:multidrug efflux pump subunit AcrB